MSTPVALTTDHPAWINVPDGSHVRLLDSGAGLWLARFTSDDGLDLENVHGGDDVKPTLAVTSAADLPGRLPASLSAPLRSLGTVVRMPNPSLWDAISTAILRQVVRASQARAVYRRWCRVHGTTVDTVYGPLAVGPGPQAVLDLPDSAFAEVGAAFHRTALQGAAARYVQHGETWTALAAQDLVPALVEIPRIGPWTACAAASDYKGDFSVYPHQDLAVRTWARRIAPDHAWPATELEFAATWRRWAADLRQLHALTLFTLTWGTIHGEDRQRGGTAPRH